MLLFFLPETGVAIMAQRLFAALATWFALLCLVHTVYAQDTDQANSAAEGDGASGDTVAVVAAPAPGPESAGSDVEIFWQILSRGHECSSEDVEIGEADTVERCAMRCAVFEGCQYFIFGHGFNKW